LSGTQVEKLGLDAAVFLRFLRLLRTLHAIVALTSLGLLLPLNLIYNRRFVASDQRNELSQLTVADVQGRWISGTISAGYVFSACRTRSVGLTPVDPCHLPSQTSSQCRSSGGTPARSLAGAWSTLSAARSPTHCTLAASW
jgi:hypothetical protein